MITDKQMLYGREIIEAAMCRPVNKTQGTFIKVGGQRTTSSHVSSLTAADM